MPDNNNGVTNGGTVKDCLIEIQGDKRAEVSRRAAPFTR